MTTALIDGDWLVYAAGFINEERVISVKHISSGKVREYKNRTEFWGGKRKEIGGWLGEVNKAREETGKRPFTKEEFEITDIQRANDISHALHTVKAMIKNVLRDTGCKDYKIFVGKGDSFRVDRSTLWKYKGQREVVLRPILKDQIVQYLLDHHGAILCTYFEADDMVIMEAYKNKDSIVVSPDKDTGGCAVKWYNPQHPDRGVIDCSGFGSIWFDEKGEVRGIGRKFFYYQVAYGDDVDNYKSNCMSSVRFGKKGAFDAIEPCKTDKECMEALKSIYMKLYPEPTVVDGWRVDRILINWEYVLNEIWDMARMMRHEKDFVKATDVLRSMGID